MVFQAKNRKFIVSQVKIVTPSAIIRPSKTEKLLGCWVQDDLKWTEHLRDNTQENLIKCLNTRVGGTKEDQEGCKLQEYKDDC